MKLLKFASASLIAFGTATALQAVTPAPVVYTTDDLFLGFRATAGTGATSDYLVDIGQASNFRDATSIFTVGGLGSISTDLIAIFGSGWYSRSDLFWSISGTPGTTAWTSGTGTDNGKTLYATSEEPTPGTQSSPWLGAASGAQGTATGKMVSLAQQFVASTSGSATNCTTNSSVDIIQNTSDANSYASFMPGGNNSDTTDAFKTFNPTVEGSFANGTAGSVLDLYRIPVGYGVAAPTLGTFQINNSAALTFTPKGVPEPSSLGLFAAASAILLASRRKRLNLTA